MKQNVKVVKTTTIIMNPTWGKTLELFQERGKIKISTADADKFKAILSGADIKYVATDLEGGSEATKLTEFVLNK